MDQSAKSGSKQRSRKPHRKSHVTKIILTNTGGMITEGGDKIAHGEGSCVAFQQFTLSWMRSAPKYTCYFTNFWDIIPFMDNNIDDIDRNILRHLQIDAAQSIDMLAEKVNLSRNACWRRVKLLEERQILTGRVATVDPAKVGLSLQVFCLLRAADHSPDWLQRFDRAVKNMPEITSAQRMSGDLDYVLKVQVADMEGYDAFYKRLITQVPLRDISASFVMESIKEGTAIPV